MNIQKLNVVVATNDFNESLKVLLQFLYSNFITFCGDNSVEDLLAFSQESHTIDDMSPTRGIGLYHLICAFT